MRRWLCVPMMILCLLATACGNTETATTPDDAREAYRTMAGCTMEAVVSCRQEDGLDWEARLRCDYVPDGTITVEVLEPESIAGIRATVSETDWTLEYEDLCLNAGTISAEEISPALCLPRLMNALREGGSWRKMKRPGRRFLACGCPWIRAGRRGKDCLHGVAVSGSGNPGTGRSCRGW